MQDIAGCRIVTESSAAQDEVVARIADVFQDVKVVDRRAAPSNSYRAVHCIVTVGKLSIEIQVRSPLQHLWAELSERASDVIDPDLKYGGGPEQWRVELELASKHVAAFERYERSVATVTALYEEWFVVAHDLEAACKEVLSGNPEDEVGKAARVELKRTQKKLARAGKERDEGLADLEASRHDLVNSLNGLIHRLNAIRRTP